MTQTQFEFSYTHTYMTVELILNCSKLVSYVKRRNIKLALC